MPEKMDLGWDDGVQVVRVRWLLSAVWGARGKNVKVIIVEKSRCWSLWHEIGRIR